jgi:hypothetical protein
LLPVNQRDASRFHTAPKFENLTHIITVMSPFGFVAVPAAVAGNTAPPCPAAVTESDPPPAALYAALPTSVPVIDPLDTKSRQLVAPVRAKLEALLASNSNVGEEETAASTETKFPDSPIAITRALKMRREERDFNRHSSS